MDRTELTDAISAWASVSIPYTSNKGTKWPSNNKHLQMIKSMLTQDGLMNGRDYVICPDYFHNSITLKFRNPENTSFYLLKWTSSEWYNK